MTKAPQDNAVDPPMPVMTERQKQAFARHRDRALREGRQWPTSDDHRRVNEAHRKRTIRGREAD